VQTFLPYPDLRASCVVLDDRRLGKQRVETFQILRALTWPQYAWKNHPAVRMWRGFVPALVLYGVESCREWTRRGYADTVAPQLLAWSSGVEPVAPELPPWFGLEPLHLSHRSALLRKDPQWYGPLFASLGEADLPDDLPYLWPPDVFPRWPVRGGSQAQPLPLALQLLGLEQARPWQAQAAEAVADGRDALLVARPGTGGSTAGLLAGLMTPGRTLWISPRPGPLTTTVPDVPLPAPRPAADRVEATEDGTGPAPAAPLARAPQAADLAAMAAEGQPAEFVFRTAAAVRDQGAACVGPGAAPGVVVVDRAGELSDDEAGAVRSVREGLGDPPLLVVTGRADPAQRTELVRRFGLREHVHAGGGWDPGSRLEAREVASPQATRRTAADLARESGPALVVVPTRERADRLATGLQRDGLRVAVWAPPPMRAGRATAALGAWRSRRLDALVVPAVGRLPLGRARVPLLVVEDSAGLDAWRDLVEQVGAERSVLLVGRGAAAEVAAYARAGGDLRARLLDRYGEPVDAS
jgi:hypothetical protein